jgi:hypothetical protein
MVVVHSGKTFNDNAAFRRQFGNPPNLAGNRFLVCGFVGLDLRGTRFAGATYQDVTFQRCNLIGANFNGVDFIGDCPFDASCQLNPTDLRNAFCNGDPFNDIC